MIQHVLQAHQILADLPPVTPSGDGMPGGGAVGKILSWVMYIALICCLIGALAGAGAVGIGNISARPHLAERGKLGFLWALGGSIMAGSAVALVNTGFGLH